VADGLLHAAADAGPIFQPKQAVQSADAEFRRLVGAAGSHFCTAAIAAASIAGLFVEFTLAHFFLDPGVFNELTKTPNRFIHTFMITQT